MSILRGNKHQRKEEAMVASNSLTEDDKLHELLAQVEKRQGPRAQRKEVFAIGATLPYPSLIREHFFLFARPMYAPGPFTQEEFSILKPSLERPRQRTPEELRLAHLEEQAVAVMEAKKSEWQESIEALHRAKRAHGTQGVDGSIRRTREQERVIEELEDRVTALREEYNAACAAEREVYAPKRRRNREPYPNAGVIERD